MSVPDSLFEEFEALKALYGSENITVEYSNCNQSNKILSRFDIVISNHFEDSNNQSKDFIKLQVEIPSGYPKDACIQCKIKDSNLNPTEIHILNKLINQKANEMIGDQSTIVVIEALRESLGTYHVVKQNKQPNYIQSDTFKSNINEIKSVVIWSHHIISKKKRRFLRKSSQDLCLNCFVKIGWPGYIVVVGLNSKVLSFVSNVKTKKWKSIRVCSEEIINDDRINLSDNSIFIEYDEKSISNFFLTIEKFGLKPLFQRGMDFLIS